MKIKTISNPTSLSENDLAELIGKQVEYISPPEVLDGYGAELISCFAYGILKSVDLEQLQMRIEREGCIIEVSLDSLSGVVL